jgi:hypothetical protein
MLVPFFRSLVPTPLTASRFLASLAVPTVLVTVLGGIAASASAGVVDVKQAPIAQSVPVGSPVSVQIVVSTASVGGQPWDSLDAIVTWDPTLLTLVGSSQVGAGAPFFLTGFLPDPDGINASLADGNALFTALGLPGAQINAPQQPGQLVVTTLQFIALAPTAGTPVDFLPTLGIFGKTRVLLGGFNVTGDTTSVATVTIVGVCPPSGHDCFTTGSAGCSDITCCDAVCAVDPFCCNNSWDSLCVDQAATLCDGCGDPTAGSCCEPHGTPFCDDADCCEAVCLIDPFCCSNEWDDLCAAATLGIASCGCDPCEVSNESCFSVHATPGCDDENCCSLVCDLDPFCCDVEWDQLCKDSANLNCGGCGLPSNGSCYCAHPTPGCNDPECCRVVCEADPFCCEVEWDGICVSAAFATCGCPFDSDLNGVIDAADLAVFLGAWGTNICPFDADSSGTVDGADLAILLGAWGDCP